MRDPKRRSLILKAFENLWEQYPDLRFNQLVMCIHNMDNAWYLEDKEFLKMILATKFMEK